jgi:hypothetical protein
MTVRAVSSPALAAVVTAGLVALCSAAVSSAPIARVASGHATYPALSPASRLLPPFVAQRLLGRQRPTRAGSWASRAASSQHIYVVDPSLDGYYGAVCYYAATGGDQLGCLAGGASSTSGIGFPQGSWVDPHHHLWVANALAPSGYSGQVTEYALPLTATSQPVNTLFSAVANPSEGAMTDYVCGNKAGDVYGTVQYTADVAYWIAGTKNTQQTGTLVDPHFSSAGSPSLADGLVACATDAKGNLFVSGQFAVGSPGNYNYFAELDEFVHGFKAQHKPIVLQKETSDLYFPAGVSIDKQGNLAWALFDLSDSGSSVCTFAKPYTGLPTACTTGFATGFHFNADGTSLWGGNTTTYPWYHQPQATVANEIGYPGGGVIRSTSGADLLTPVDASVNPPLELK